MKKSVHQNSKKYWWNRKSHDNSHRLQMIYRTFADVISYKTQHFAKRIIDKQLYPPINKHLSAFVNFKKRSGAKINAKHTSKSSKRPLWIIYEANKIKNVKQRQSIWVILISQNAQMSKKRRVPPLLGSTHLRMQPEDVVILMPKRKTIGSDKYLDVVVHT
jgi:hypothetical protein